MLFVRNGPDIPESLLQAHEEGNVVFFCGAGVSYPAALPDFKGLVDQLYQKLNTTKEIIEQRAFEQDKYDATIDLLERRYSGSRVAVRTVLIDILKPKWPKKDATTTHES
jgi:NAD-dependent SIR2 family protein deacetylase